MGSAVNFALYCDGASAVTLLLFEPKAAEPFARFALDPTSNRTGQVWHCALDGLASGTEYGYLVAGPFDPARGLFFSAEDLLCDPYARRLSTPQSWGEEGQRRSVIPEVEPFDWQDSDRPLTSWKETVIYEMHLRGFTQDPSSCVHSPGTFLGLIEKIPHLQSLGVTAVELLPIFEFDETDHPHPSELQPLYNYWGYSPLHFFYPMGRYAEVDPIAEFRTMVRELHKAGIEVILDVVYNHTGEHGLHHKAFAYRGLAASSYYMIGEDGHPRNDSGCGNTMNTNHPVCIDLIVESLRYWVAEMGVDGFRFDLASILTRAEDGTPLAHPPVVEAITKDPLLADVKLIAEAWDAAGLYQVGHFPGGERWREWNGKYRDDVRDFIKGTDGFAGHFATRIGGSQDLYDWSGPTKSVNFITAHDGFTLRDLVSYNEKHNEANGEENRDGNSTTRSWNCGAEGTTDDPHILALRERQMRNFHLALFLSHGVPMIVMGDEYGHTKDGNNNAYCHDSRINWFQWDTLEKKSDFWRFYRGVIEIRRRHPLLSHATFLTAEEIQWHGREPLEADWSGTSRFVAFTLVDRKAGRDLYAAFNADHEGVEVRLPRRADGRRWAVRVDTGQPPPHDYFDEEVAPLVCTDCVYLTAHSALLLQATL